MKTIFILGITMLLSTTTFASKNEWYNSRYAPHLSSLQLKSGEHLVPVQKFEISGTFKPSDVKGVSYMFKPEVILIPARWSNLFSQKTVAIGSLSAFRDAEFKNIGEYICRKNGLKYFSHQSASLGFYSAAFVDGDQYLFVSSTSKYGSRGSILYGVFCQKQDMNLIGKPLHSNPNL